MKQRWAICLILFFLALGLIVFPTQAAEGAAQGLRMCGTAVIPALLPFFVLTRLLLALLPPLRAGKRLSRLMEKYFGVSGACIRALALSMIGGYPVGVNSVVTLYENAAISKEDAQCALRFCNNSGPAFFISIVGAKVLGSVRAGLVLYFLHCLSALLTGIAFSQPARHALHRQQRIAQPVSTAAAFQSAVSESCAALLQICALVLLFSVLQQVLTALGLFRWLSKLPLGLSAQELQALFSGALELSSGILRLSGSRNAFVFCALLMGWGGFCVHMQAISLWQPTGLRPRGYFAAKLLHGLLCALFAAALVQKTVRSAFYALCVCGLCLLLPRIRQKKSGNPYQLAV